jgi:hypothetical protein
MGIMRPLIENTLIINVMPYDPAHYWGLSENGVELSG